MLGEIVEDRYLIEAELGEGAMGRVYQARHIKVGRAVAIKVMHRELAKVPSIVERFAREATVAARLRHPNVVSVLDVGTSPERMPMIIMELAPGDKLTRVVDGPLSTARVIHLLRGILRGLDHAHTAGLIHRDLKPDNILVETTSDGEEIPRIVDFGIAVTSDRDDDSVAGRRLTEANTVIGTPFYMSPEQARAKDLDHRTDLFSLGVIAYELLAGMPPFPGSSVDVALANASKDPPAILDRAGVHVDPLLESFARKLMSRKREERFQTAAEALAVLELIERDRIAAARALTGDVIAPAPVPALVIEAPVTRIPTNSDALSTLPAITEDREPPVTRVSRLTRIPQRSALAGIVAALAVLAVMTWTVTKHDGDAPRISVANAAAHSDVAKPALVVTPIEVPVVAELPVVVEKPAALGKPVVAAAVKAVIAKPAVAKPAVAKPVAQARRTAIAAALPTVAVQPAVAATPTVAAPAPKTEAETLVARYVAVGKALRGSPQQLWAHYRHIHIIDALRTHASRQAALATLEQIERQIVRN